MPVDINTLRKSAKGGILQYHQGVYDMYSAGDPTSGQFLQANSSGLWVPHTLVAADIPAHNLLSATHGDTTAGTVVRGDLVVGDSTPKWVRFAKGTSGTFLKQGANDPAWTALAASDIQSGTLALARGGTNADLSATGGTGQYLKQSSSGAAVTVGTISDTDVSSTAWTTYTPTITSGTGTFTSVSGAGSYKLLGKTLIITVTVTITNNGTAATYVSIPLPSGTCASNTALTGRASAVSGKQLQGVIAATTGAILVFNYDNTYPGATGETLIVSGVIELA